MSAANKSLLFFLGLVLGLLAGAGFFIFKMDDIMKKINVFSSSKDTIIIQQQPGIQEEKKNKAGKYTAPPGAKDTGNTMTSAEMLASKYSREVPIRKIMAEADSLLRDNIAAGKDSLSAQGPEHFVVRKDELLGAKNIAVIHLQPADPENPLDTVLEKVSGIKTQKNAMAAFKVEFWQSPINYRGYKMTKNKILLFGLDLEENVKLFHLDETIFLKQGANYYKLVFTDEFKQFEKISDAGMIGKLSKQQ